MIKVITNVKEAIDLYNEVCNEFPYVDREKISIISQEMNSNKRKGINLIGERLLKAVENNDNEILRVKKLYDFDRILSKNLCIAGVDEVGRGPLAGPIASAAVILNLNCEDIDMILFINDSKKLSSKKRVQLSSIITEKAISFNIAQIESEMIDEKGIAWCNNEVLKNAVMGLKVVPDIVISDGYPVKGLPMENKYAIKGDSKSASIACASIIAKVYRDNLMIKYGEKYTSYGFENNAGYGTKEHIEAIKKFGVCSIHRKSFLKNI